MSNKIDKIINSWRNSPVNVSFADIEKVLTHLGYTLRKGKGSHMVFKKPGHHSITIPKARPVDECYVEIVLETYDEESGKQI